MHRNFVSEWEKETEDKLFSKAIGKVHHDGSLKEQISSIIFRLKLQQNKLSAASARMQEHDKEIFTKCVNAQMAHDSARASMYANECAEVRKMAKVTLHCQMALEQVALRLETIEEFGSVATMMGPVASVVRTIKSQISGIMPEVGFELNEIGEVLNGAVVEAGEAPEMSYVESSNSQAQKILDEANAVAEQHMKERFPDLPATPRPKLPGSEANTSI